MDSMEFHGIPWIKIKAQGSRLKDQGSRLKAQGSRLKDQGSRTKVKDKGPCPAMNEHPRRATDMILRQVECSNRALQSQVVFMGEFMVQILVYDETTNVYELLL